ncbi:cardiolipin synthase [Tropicibacter sp. R16_0]|uniref:cardiolipin synthase n=1 Tax=Tropicibacter sp. R16_0 TaxID=2821102 RepID=UPI001ADB6639|nr:cardiolipin synthase [Tropicibacter sp. R16_0]MBO9449763.1 cardiolipin synthase [Tropicibacter sp. R16_0]
MWSFLLALSVLLLFISAVLCAVRAAQTARTPQGAVGWVVFLLAVPWAGVPLYLFLGHHRFTGYRIARRESERVVQGIKAYSEHIRPAPETLTMNVKPFEAIANLPVLKGNEAKLLVDGEATFSAIFDAIDAAQDYILIQFYIVRADDLGLRLQAKLIEAAARGVKVRFMTDAVGSYHLPNSYYEEMRSAGIDIVMPADQRGPKYRFQLNYRNHRKTVVIDGTTGFIGGHNVGDEYLGLDPKFGRWRDTHMRISGPIVSQLQLIFVEDWHWARDEDLLDALNWAAPDVEDNANAVIVATGPGDTTETGSMMFFSAIAAAQERIWLASPYFVPDIDVMTALTNAAMRGVDVRLLVPDVIDHKMPWLAAFAYFDEIIEAGVKVYRYTDGFMHQKAFVVDHALAAVGTTNLDNRSFRLNFEAMALFFDADIAADVDEMFQVDFENSYELVKPLALQPAFVRYGAPLARLVSPIL